jgi:tRNA-2-methylthio-N6-dimethylallyladenosine synthase
MNRVFIKTYGCQMNERDSEAVAAMLRQRGYVMVPREQEADVILLNTCSIRDQAEQKAIGKAHQIIHLKEKNPHLLVGIMGCMAQNRGKDLLDRLPDLDLLVGTQKFHHVPDHLDHIITTLKAQGPRPSTVVDLDAEEGSQNTIRLHPEMLERKVTAYVSIMQGCNMRCAYCIVPTTRGAERCRPIEDIVEEVEGLVAKGVKEVTLLGQIVNSYGRREIPFLDGKSPFVQLLEAVHAIEGVERIRFTSPHPVGFKQDLIEAFGRLPKLGSYVHLPLQSGSDPILKAMNRPYTVEQFRKIVHALRQQLPDLCLSTDIIVGFPGETDEDFEATRQVFEEMDFDSGFIFKYSVRPGTPAEALGDPIPPEVKEARNQILLQILEKQALRRNEGLVGTIQTVLVEEPARKGEGLFMGRTFGGRRVLFPGSERLVGESVSVKILEAHLGHVKGELVLAV